MANPQDEDVRAMGKHRHRRPHHPHSPSLSDPRDWEETQQPVVDSLPYRSRASDIQMPDSRTPEHSSSSRRHHRRRASEDMRARESMPPPSLSRSATVTHPRGRYVSLYGDDEPSSSPERRPRTRRGPRSVSASSSAESEGHSRKRDVMVTPPPRSAHVNHSTPDSRRTSRSSSSRRAPSVDSASTALTQDEVKNILRRRPSEIEVLPDAVRPGRRSHRKKHSGREQMGYEEIAYRHVPAVEGSETHHRRRRHHSESRSSSHRHQHHHSDHHDTVRPASGSKRSTETRSHRQYYTTDSVYRGKPKLPRSASSQITSVRSASTSSRRSTIISSFFGPSIHPPRPVKLVDCFACMDEGIPSTKTARLKCGHRMCHSCMKRLFKISIKDPQQMPPKCCENPLPVKHVDRLFDTSFKKTWNNKFAEFSTRNRIYCPARRCGEWIKPDRIQKFKDGRKYAKCSHCKTEVCCVCNGKWHKSRDCPQDEATRDILQQANENGWQRCYSCKSLVELAEGCNHMTCRCGSEFCMICGAKWKSCECPWFNYDAEEDRLEQTQVPVTVRPERDRLSIRDARGHSTRHAQAYEEVTPRRMKERPDETLVLQPQYEDVDDEYMDSYDALVGLGHAAGHHMNDDYRRVHRVPAAPSPPMAAVDRANGGDYVSGVKRERGVRASSMERRLAERFSEARRGASPTHRAFTHVMSPPHLPPGMGMSPPGPPPMGPFLRRHTMDDDLYGGHPRPRMAERIVVPGRGRGGYEAEAAIHAPLSRRRQGEQERLHPKGSVLAGLTGPGSGMSRVSEWRSHVAPGEPEVVVT